MDSIVASVFSFAIPFALIGLYFYFHYKLAKKAQLDMPWLAFIPVVNMFQYFSIAGMSWLWGLTVIFPPVFIVVMIVAGIKLSRRFGQRGWFVLLLMTPIVNYWALYKLGKGNNYFIGDDKQRDTVQKILAAQKEGKTVSLENAGLSFELREKVEHHLQNVPNKNVELVGKEKAIAAWVSIVVFLFGFIFIPLALVVFLAGFIIAILGGGIGDLPTQQNTSWATSLYTSTQDKAKDGIRHNDVEMINNALNLYLASTGNVFPSADNIGVLDAYLFNGFPTDPDTGKKYSYEVNADGSKFCITATLSTGKKIEEGKCGDMEEEGNIILMEKGKDVPVEIQGIDRFLEIAKGEYTFTLNGKPVEKEDNIISCVESCIVTLDAKSIMNGESFSLMQGVYFPAYDEISLNTRSTAVTIVYNEFGIDNLFDYQYRELFQKIDSQPKIKDLEEIIAKNLSAMILKKSIFQIEYSKQEKKEIEELIKIISSDISL